MIWTHLSKGQNTQEMKPLSGFVFHDFSCGSSFLAGVSSKDQFLTDWNSSVKWFLKLKHAIKWIIQCERHLKNCVRKWFLYMCIILLEFTQAFWRRCFKWTMVHLDQSSREINSPLWCTIGRAKIFGVTGNVHSIF